jgi:DUF4097 and DUF4098 domain-containing protein YvlB
MQTSLSIICIIISMLQVRIPIRTEDSREEKIVRSLQFTGTGSREFVVDIVNGSIDVTGYDGPTAEVTVHKRLMAETADKLQAAEENVKIEFSEEGNRVKVRLNAPWRLNNGRVEDQAWKHYGYDAITDIRVKLPRETNLVLKTTNKGDIMVDTITGRFDVLNINGNIMMKGMAGAGRAGTTNGSITIGFRQNPLQDLVCKTINGQVQIHLQAGLSAVMVMGTLNGEILTDFEGIVSPDQIHTEAHGFKRLYRVDKSRSLTVGKDGPQFSFTTTNGNITVLKSE